MCDCYRRGIGRGDTDLLESQANPRSALRALERHDVPCKDASALSQYFAL